MRKYIIWTLFIALLVGCSKDKDDQLQLSTDNVFTLNNDEHILRIGITSDSEWNVKNTERWCTIQQVNGTNSDSLVITVAANIAPEQRSVILEVSNKGGSKTDITINQAKRDGEYHFRLPVIFHIMYMNASNPKQNIETWRIQDLLDQANAYYKNANSLGVDMNLTFELATRDPDGKLLAESGIHRIQRYTNYSMECDKFLNNGYNDIQLMWDPNKYINIFLFEFDQVVDKNVTGVSILPFTPSSNPLDGLISADGYYNKLPTTQVIGLALNNLYAYTTFEVGNIVYQDIMALTLTHELGHYLGLKHVFSTSTAVESDYCEDTPDYNRKAYSDWLNTLSPVTWAQAIQRTDRNDISFISTNHMDYDYSEKNRFTRDQRSRIRHVLEYSPLIPGPKMPVTIARSANNDAEVKAIIIK